MNVVAAAVAKIFIGKWGWLFVVVVVDSQPPSVVIVIIVFVIRHETSKTALHFIFIRR